MSNFWGRILPVDPQYIPDAAAQLKALLIWIESDKQTDGVSLEIHQHMVCYFSAEDSGWGTHCPHCESDIDDNWLYDALCVAASTQTSTVTVPCCSANLPFHDLNNPDDSGIQFFALGRFCLRADTANPVLMMEPSFIHQLETLLGCPLRVMIENT